MKLLICGSRTWSDIDAIRQHILALQPTEIIHGGARGADSLADKVAKQLNIPTTPYPADWKRYGTTAGHIRNRAMLDSKPDHLLAFYLGTPGTRHMIENARKLGIPVTVVSP